MALKENPWAWFFFWLAWLGLGSSFSWWFLTLGMFALWEKGNNQVVKPEAPVKVSKKNGLEERGIS